MLAGTIVFYDADAYPEYLIFVVFYDADAYIPRVPYYLQMRIYCRPLIIIACIVIIFLNTLGELRMIMKCVL